MFEETPVKYLEQAKGFGLDLQQMADQKKLKLIYLRPLDLSVDETLHEIQAGCEEVQAKRVVIDSLTGLEIAAPVKPTPPAVRPRLSSVPHRPARPRAD